MNENRTVDCVYTEVAHVNAGILAKGQKSGDVVFHHSIDGDRLEILC